MPIFFISVLGIRTWVFTPMWQIPYRMSAALNGTGNQTQILCKSCAHSLTTELPFQPQTLEVCVCLVPVCEMRGEEGSHHSTSVEQENNFWSQFSFTRTGSRD